ncbi:MAG: integrin alpha [Anaerolineae bacterium]
MKRLSTWTSALLMISIALVGLTAVGADSSAQSTITVSLAASDLTFLGEEAADWAGYGVGPAGDVNGDGLGDMIIGAPMAGNKDWSLDVPKGEGIAYLVLGRPHDQWPTDHINLADADASFIGCDVTSMTGRQNYTAGDVNGDGYDDILISGWKCGINHQGKALLFLGRPNVDWGYHWPAEQADASFVGEFDWDHLSYYTATAGDVNGDGYDDFLIASTHNDEAGLNAGQVYLILGRATADWGLDYPITSADASFLAENVDDRLGRSAVGVGDTNGDGYDDFLIGAISSDDAADTAGEVYLILGRAAADWGMDYPIAAADASWLGEAANDELGRRVAGAGDVNNDGLADFLMASSRNDQAGTDVGKTYLFLGRAQANWGLDAPVTTADATFLGDRPLEQSGRRVAGAGDVIGDGIDDFMIGAPHNNRVGIGAGAVYLMYGRQAGDWGFDYPLTQADVIYLAEEQGDRAGYDLTWLGDTNGDGIDDILISAYQGRQLQTVAGKAHVIYGTTSGPGPGVPPEPILFVPDATEGVTRDWHLFSGVYEDLDGLGDMTQLSMILGLAPDDPQRLEVRYDVMANELYLLDDDGVSWLGPCTPGERTSLQTDVAVLACWRSRAIGNGATKLRLDVFARFWMLVDQPRVLNVYLQAVDAAGNDSGQVPFGTWTLLPKVQ